MLARLVPERIKEHVRQRIRRIVNEETPAQRVFQPYYESHKGADEYVVSKLDDPPVSEITRLPVAPVELRVGYGPNTDLEGKAYTEGGRRDVAAMVDLLAEGGFDAAGSKRVLDFGCAAGRMICHLPGVAPNAQLWGTDICADHIRWCRHHLSTVASFAVTTKVPHLPFRDGFFDLIYCGSVFTHIEDLEEMWLLELARILEPGGRLYLTIHDDDTVQLFETKFKDARLARKLQEHPVYLENRHDFKMIVVGRGEMSYVFYNTRYFLELIPPLFRLVTHMPAAYGYQSAVILERVAD